jgi:hypothetical protein
MIEATIILQFGKDPELTDNQLEMVVEDALIDAGINCVVVRVDQEEV